MSNLETSVIPQTRSNVIEGNLPSLNKGFDIIREFIENYNSSPDVPEKIDSNQILAGFKAAGAVNDDIVKSLSAKAISDITGLSEILANALHKKLSATGHPDRSDRILTRLSAKSYSTEALLNKYNPHEIDSAVTDELLTRAKRATGRNPRVIVFNEDMTVNSEASWSLLQDALRGDPDLKSVTHNSKLAYTYKIGEVPADVVEIHPISGKALRSNGAGSDGFNWGDTSLEARQLLHLAVQTGELDAQMSRRDRAYYFNLALSDKAVEQLQIEFPRAARKFIEQKTIGGLPALKRFRNREMDLGNAEGKEDLDQYDILSNFRS